MRYIAKCSGAKLPKQYDLPFDNIQFFPERLEDRDLARKGPLKIFVGSVSDHAYWRDVTKWKIIICMKHYKQHTFMMLTKDPTAYDGFKWPKNVMCGTTITFYKGQQIEKIAYASLQPRPFLSIEPLLGCVPKVDYSRFETIIVGPDNTKGAEPPHPEWVQSVKDNIPKEKIWWKK
jgi:protein gp37